MRPPEVSDELAWDLPDPFTLPVQVEKSHIDGLNHTNNAVYVQWCEQVAWAHSLSLGQDLESYRALNRAMAVTRAEYQYLKASRLGDNLVAATWIIESDRKLNMTRHFQIQRVSDRATLLRGRVKFTCIDLEKGRPRRMPPEFLRDYEPAILDLGPDALP